MTTARCATWVALAMAASTVVRAQPIIMPPPPDVLVMTQFHTPLTYEAVLSRLDKYYDEQIGRKAAVAFPAIGPKQHYDLWHDVWAFFEPEAAGMKVTLKRPASPNTGQLLVKTWILNLAGRMDAPLPLTFKELPPLHQADAELYGSARDIARALQADASMKPLETWEHAGLVVSAAPMVSVILTKAGVHGVHHVTVTAETVVLAKQLLARVEQAVQKPGIYAVYSEATGMEQEIQAMAKAKADSMGSGSSQAIYVPMVDPKLLEANFREDPEVKKRVIATQGQYDVSYRIDKPYRKIAVSWTALPGYSRATGAHDAETALGETVVTAPKAPPQAGAHLTARIKIDGLQPGAYRIALQGESVAGAPVKIDSRIYWFDGKTFEEL